MTTLLPSLQGEIDLNNLKENISFGFVKLSGHYNGVLKITEYFDSLRIIIEDPNFKEKEAKMYPELYYTNVQYSPDERVNDMIKMFSNEINENISQTATENNGTIQLKLLSFKERNNPLLIFFSIWTLCVPTLIGIPLNNINTTLEIQVTISNLRNETLGTYKANGYGNTFIAMYWGYGSDAHRKSALAAFADAMTTIKEQIRNNKTELKPGLTRK
ncbi:MAG: hypothetical protein A3G23_11555 [Bacteroidetes bacterium RIFCSPLOWO2_12_FULL_37_12]|nr:MAG: hypothetical protein A3G23_11555 [Bacteroidetes bacterium RIFCSPLOWO2_12_FULL_37_12]